MTEHYFSKNPKGEFRKECFEVDILDETVKINSGSGIFSLDKLDFGTELLIKNAKIENKKLHILDLGCGYGIIGIMMKKKHPDLNVMMIDVNDRAVKLAKQNCRENKIECEVFQSDIFLNPKTSDKKFDIILTNPPFSAGKSVCIEFIKQSFSHLNKNGSLQLVAPHNKGGESLKKIMLETFGNVKELAKKSGFRVYYSEKK